MEPTVLHVVSLSTGKDSEATLCYALETQPRDSIRAVFADTGNEAEEVYEHLDYLEQATGVPVKRLRRSFDEEIARTRARLALFASGEKVDTRGHEDGPKWTKEAAARALELLVPTGNPYLDLCLWKGRFPSRMAQFCTQFLKTEPMVEYQMDLIDAGHIVWSWQGVRRNESPRRQYAREFEEVGGGLFIYRPIVRWTAADCFEAAAAYNLKSNPLYTQGFTRVGCMPCINSGKDDLLQVARRHPEHIERIAEWEKLVASVSKRGDASFIPDPDRDAHMNKRGIHKVIQWARTGRGGKTYDMFRAVEDEGGCSSSYGLCE